MERKSCCSSMNYGSRTTVVSPRKEDVKPEVIKKEAAEFAKGTSGADMAKAPKTEEKAPKTEEKAPKTEEKVNVQVKEEESVKVNIGSGCCGE